MIAILTTASASTYYPINLRLGENTDMETQEARIVRTACIDGTSVTDYLALADGDRTFNIQADLSDCIEQFRNMMSDYTDFVLTNWEGVFKGVIQRIGQDTIQFAVSERL